MIHVFHRTWWKQTGDPNRLEPYAGRKITLAHVESEAIARIICQDWNAANDPGHLSDKAEYELEVA